MRIVSGFIRIITGLGIMVTAIMVYISNREQLTGSEPVDVTIFGVAFNATPTQVIISLVVAGILGALIETLGVFTLLRKPKAKSE